MILKILKIFLKPIEIIYIIIIISENVVMS